MHYSAIYRRRTAITTTLPGTTPVDFDVTIPPEWDRFWSTIDTSGNNLRVIAHDGRTVLTYALDDGSGGAFSKANKTGRLRLDGVVVPATASMGLLYLYWDPTSNQSSGTSAVTMASVQPAYIELGNPIRTQHRFKHRGQTPRAGRPRDRIHKTTTEQTYVWISYTDTLGRRVSPGNGSTRHEDLLHATHSVDDNAGSDVATMYDATQLRFVETPQGEMWVRVRVKAGTDDTNYTLIVLARTVQPGESSAAQQLETRIGVAVRDTLDP